MVAAAIHYICYQILVRCKIKMTILEAVDGFDAAVELTPDQER